MLIFLLHLIMFKKIQKKKNSLILENDTEEQIAIIKNPQKKKLSKWIDIPVKTNTYTTDEINSFIQSSEKNLDGPDKQSPPVDAFSELYGRDFNESVDQLVKSIRYKAEVESLDSVFSSSEELESIEASSDADEDSWTNNRAKFAQHSGKNDTAAVTVDTFRKFLEDKIHDVKLCKEKYSKRLSDIKRLKQDSKEIKSSLHMGKQ